MLSREHAESDSTVSSSPRGIGISPAAGRFARRNFRLGRNFRPSGGSSGMAGIRPTATSRLGAAPRNLGADAGRRLHQPPCDVSRTQRRAFGGEWAARSRATQHGYVGPRPSPMRATRRTPASTSGGRGIGHCCVKRSGHTLPESEPRKRPRDDNGSEPNPRFARARD
jgi:hypothetical protein